MYKWCENEVTVFYNPFQRKQQTKTGNENVWVIFDHYCLPLFQHHISKDKEHYRTRKQIRNYAISAEVYSLFCVQCNNRLSFKSI